MKERLEKLKILLEELKSDSYAEQYGICDFVDRHPNIKAKSDQLAEECAFYQNTLDKIEKLCQFKQ